MIHIICRIGLAVFLSWWAYICWSMVGESSGGKPTITSAWVAWQVFCIPTCTAILGYLSVNRKGDW